jgi:hypothetical protein
VVDEVPRETPETPEQVETPAPGPMAVEHEPEVDDNTLPGSDPLPAFDEDPSEDEGPDTGMHRLVG